MDYVNAFKARLDKTWLHQEVKFVSCIGLGPNFSTCNGLGGMGQSADGLDRVTQNGPMDDSGLDEPVTHNERFFVAKFLNWQSSKLSCIRLFIGATLTRKAKK